ncbi:AmmeMemoRadiSam system radical SAM enzyme [Methanomethylophilus alvi]|uniref:AmmeMemoRadiSam system radical SAM enzyme n=1 Tax=Methanomethylophilus alvi TaxID=1291540 RepID=UPI0037DC4C14
MAFINPNIEARHWHIEDGNIMACDLCPHRCRIQPEGFGRCTARKAVNGKLVAYNYGRISSMAVDPIEKKPFYHYRPGTRIFSVGSVGCNLHCEYCQNYSISMSPIGKKRTTFKSAEDIAAFCRQQNFDQIAFTYNEPSIWFEYIMDVHDCDPDLKIALVTNGYVCEEPLKELCSVSDAMNIDVKAFNDRFYNRLCGGKLEDVKRSCEVVFEQGVHLELTYLVIPGQNDSTGEVAKFVEWVRDSLSPDVPVHFSRFHPDYNMMTTPMTPVDTLLRFQGMAEDSGLNYAYVGNILHDDASDTYCPECGAAVIKRTGYMVDIIGLDGDRCAFCKHRLNIIR